MEREKQIAYDLLGDRIIEAFQEAYDLDPYHFFEFYCGIFCMIIGMMRQESRDRFLKFAKQFHDRSKDKIFEDIRDVFDFILEEANPESENSS